MANFDDNIENEFEDLTLRFFVTDFEVGSIIGMKGENIKNLRNESGTRINISDGSNYDRIVSIRGTGKQVVKAVYLILHKFQADQVVKNVHEGENGVSLRLIVPNNNCGSLIGRNGGNIKELREKTGAKIQVANVLLPKSTEREVTVAGSIDKVIECVEKLAKIALETKPNVPHTPYNALNDVAYFKGGRTRDATQRRSNGFDDLKPFRPQDAFLNKKIPSGMTTEEIIVPNQIVGFIIGKSGVKINEIRHNSGTQIKIVEDNDQAARFIISGARANVQSAVHSIQSAKTRRMRRSNRTTSDESYQQE